MSEIVKAKQLNLLFNKKDIALMLGCNYHNLIRFMPADLKNQLNWSQSGKAMFKDAEVDQVIQYFRPLLTREERLKIIYPNGF